MKLTENEVVLHLKTYLENNGWKVNSFCLGQQHGCDIEAAKNEEVLVIEAKGARSGATSPIREHFNSGQIKTHFGKAIVTTLDGIHNNPKFTFAIAHPEDKDIRKAIGHLLPLLRPLNIKHYWISSDGNVIEE